MILDIILYDLKDWVLDLVLFLIYQFNAVNKKSNYEEFLVKNIYIGTGINNSICLTLRARTAF